MIASLPRGYFFGGVAGGDRLAGSLLLGAPTDPMLITDPPAVR